jgi:DNA helicase-2/ATP-dependent DNA helicase PcrA
MMDRGSAFPLTCLEGEGEQGVQQREHNLLEGLNAAQRKAVEATEGPVLVLAGAGTGKTKVLTTRIAYLVAERKCFLSQILAVTFTNKAAQEMKERVARMTADSQYGPRWLGTFHHIGSRILRRHGEKIGIPENFTILDTDDQLRLVKQILKGMNLSEKNYAPRVILWAIGRFKDRGLMPQKVTKAECTHLQIYPHDQDVFMKLYAAYQAALMNLGVVDFGDLLLLNLELFQKRPDVLEHYSRLFRYILVDEYQDINVAQYLWLRYLTQENQNICCVGDDDQSIYGWRGAEVDHILRFERDFPGTKLVKLEDNYRSTAAILTAASHLIAHNRGRLGKTLRPALNLSGEKIVVKGLATDREEAGFIGERIVSLSENNVSLSSIAVLVRAGFQTRELEERFLLLGIPYRLVGALQFYQRAEIKDVLAYLRVIHRPQDSLAFERIVNVPKRGLGNTSLQKLHLYARENQVSLFEAAEVLVSQGAFGKAAQANLAFFLNLVQGWRQATEQVSLQELLNRVLKESGYWDMWQGSSLSDAETRLENLKELVKVVQDFASLEQFLEHVSLVTDLSPQTAESAVTLMTLHMAKGLEFDYVFLSGWEEGLFPHPRTLEEQGQKGAEEERRLAYVGITRARKHATITFAWNRRFYQGWQQCLPSRFLEELPREAVLLDSETILENHRGGSTSLYSKPFVQNTSTTASKDSKTFQKGDRIFHEKFGYGYILGVEGRAAHILFKMGERKIVFDFLQLAPKNHGG